MPRLRQSTGRPGTATIPSDWEKAPAVVVERGMRGTVELRHPGTTQQWDPDTDQMVAAPNAPYYVGPARVQALTAQARRVVTGEDAEIYADHLVAVPLRVDATRSGDLVKVTAAHDSTLVGRVLVVRQVELGTERFERDLFATLAD